MIGAAPRYAPSPKHCPPQTAQVRGVRCPRFSAEIAQALLDESLPMGDKRVATRSGMAFVAQRTYPDGAVWHGYPEAWDKIDVQIKQRWLREGKVRRRDLRRWETREDVEAAWRDEDGDG